MVFDCREQLQWISEMLPNTECVILGSDAKNLEFYMTKGESPSSRMVESYRQALTQRTEVFTLQKGRLYAVLPLDSSQSILAVQLIVESANSVEGIRNLLHWQVKWLDALLISKQKQSGLNQGASPKKASIESIKSRLSGSRKKKALAAVVIAASACSMIPVTYNIPIETVIQARQEYRISAPYNGYISAAHVEVGDLVDENDPLLVLDNRELRIEAERLKSESLEYDKSRRRAMAKRDFVEAEIFLAKQQQVNALIELNQYKDSQSTLKAPVYGVVMTGSLQQALGAPVNQGDVLTIIAPHGEYQALLKVAESDIRFLQEKQEGLLKLNSLPGVNVPVSIESIRPIFDSSGERPVYHTDAKILTDNQESFRPGMEGIAKINVGKFPLYKVLFHHLFDWVVIQYWKLI